MSEIAELFGMRVDAPDVDWPQIVGRRHGPFSGKPCYKVRKSNPEISIGTCTVLHGRKKPEPIVICPTRLIEHKRIFTDCLPLLAAHEPGNELHLLPEVTVPGGSIDYVLLSLRDGEIRDFVGIELQALDTTGTIWPVRQRLLRNLGVAHDDGGEDPAKPFGMNWKMTAKTTLIQMHHKVQTFEHVNHKLVLVLQDRFLSYMTQEFKFDRVKSPAAPGDSLRLHAYRMARADDGSFQLSMAAQLGTDVEGIARCLDLQAEARIELKQIVTALRAKASPRTLFQPG